MDLFTLVVIVAVIFVIIFAWQSHEEAERKRREAEERAARDSIIAVGALLVGLVGALTVGAAALSQQGSSDDEARRRLREEGRPNLRPRILAQPQSDWRLLPVDPELWYNERTGDLSACVPGVVDDAQEQSQRDAVRGMTTVMESSTREGVRTRQQRMACFEKNNRRNGRSIIDLHDLWVSEAISKLRERLQLCQDQHVPCLLIITGWGKNSPGGAARIRPAAIQLLHELHLCFSEPPSNPGVLLVTF